MTAQPKHKYTLEEYLELDHNSEEKIEYYNGNVWTLGGASIAHNQIVANVVGELRSAFRSRGCQVFPSDTLVHVPNYPPYRYPDVSALCGKVEARTIGKQEMLINPQLIVEVLSDSTEGFDRGDKFLYYKSIPSFIEYLLISQRRANVVQYVKQSENVWLQSEFNDLSETVELKFVECGLALSEIYQNVEFPPRLEMVSYER